MVQPCQSCRKPSTRRCSGCTTVTAWYCSPECQKAHWIVHIFDCNPRRAITTADHLALAVHASYIPTDLQTCEDYGFSQMVTVKEKTHLLALYIGLMERSHVNSKKIHSWRINGTLMEEIKSSLEAVPEHSRGGEYRWFLENKHLLNTTVGPPVQRMFELRMRPAWDYAGIPQSYTDTQRYEIMCKWSETKRCCVLLCSSIFSQFHPPNFDPSWLHFGYCICRDDISKVLLAQMYAELMKRCSFDEFCTAYESSSLLHLIDSRGLEAKRRRFPHLEDVLRGSPVVFKSVWHLKQFVIAGEGMIPPSIMADYGFVNCKDQQEQVELKAVYKVFLLEKGGDPIALHEAAMQGRLFRHVGAAVKLSKKFKMLMKFPYESRKPVP